MKERIIDCIDGDVLFTEQLSRHLSPYVKKVRIFYCAEDYMLDERIRFSRMLITNIALPGDLTGLDLIKILKSRHPELSILLTSGFNSDEYLFQALKSGASGYFLKSDLDNVYPFVKEIIKS